MSRLAIRPARRSSAKPLIAFYAEGGGGKTRAALTLARGFVGASGKIVMIETESGRGEAYAGRQDVAGDFFVVPLHYDPADKDCENTYSPENYGEAISVAEREKADALIVDSCSHEWEGIGGVLDWAEKNREEGKKGQQVWLQPKMMHQRHFLSRLLMTPIPLVILCLRAKYPMEEKVVNGKKEMFRSEKLEPKQSSDILYDIFVHGWFDRETHCFHATHYQDDSLATVIENGKPITQATGAALARWAAGVTLDSVMASMKAATTLDELKAAIGPGRVLGGEDKAKVKEFLEKRKEELGK
jgi:hypothetical protein